MSLIFAGGFAGGFYHNPPTFDAAAGHMAPPPYSAPLGQQPPRDPDLPSSAAGTLTEFTLVGVAWWRGGIKTERWSL